MTFTELTTSYGLQAAFLLYFIYKELWPWARDKVFPAYAQQKRAETQALSKALDDHRIAAQQREDRLFSVVEAATRALADLKGAMEGIKDTLTALNAELERHADVLHNVNLDIAGLYGTIGKDRPSRVRRRISQQENAE